MLKSVSVVAATAFVVTAGLGGQASAGGNNWSDSSSYGSNNSQHTVINYSNHGSQQYRGSERDHSYSVQHSGNKHENNNSYSSYNYKSESSHKTSYVHEVSKKVYVSSSYDHKDDKKYEKHDNYKPVEYKHDDKKSYEKHDNYNDEHKNDYKKVVKHDYKQVDYKKHDEKKHYEPKQVKKVVYKPVKYVKKVVKYDNKKHDYKNYDQQYYNHDKGNHYEHVNHGHNDNCWLSAVNANNSQQHYMNGDHVKVGTNLWIEAMSHHDADDYDWYIRHNNGHWNMVNDHDDYIDYTVWEKGSYEFKAVPKDGSDCSECVLKVHAY